MGFSSRRLPAFAAAAPLAVLLAFVPAGARGAGDEDLRNASGNDANLHIVRQLLERGADPNAPDTLGRTAVHRAADGGAARTLETLLANGGGADARDDDGNTPLHWAASIRDTTKVLEGKSVASLRVLLEGGADPNVANRDGDTPLHVAARDHGGSPGLELLLRAGADPNEANRWGNTPLHAAVGPHGRQSAEAVRALTDAGADPEAVNRDGLTPLLFFARNGTNTGEIAALLLRAGADPDRKAPNGDTPLHIAVDKAPSSGEAEVVDALLAGGADPCVKDARGFIPYNVAREGGWSHRALDRAHGYDRACDLKEQARDAVADARAGEEALGLTRDQRRRVQEGLAAEGFDPGPADGSFGPRTRGAIGGWQEARNDAATGYLDEGQARALLGGGAEAAPPADLPECVDAGDHRHCLVEIDNRPGCHVYGHVEVGAHEYEWSGGCEDGLAHGKGTLSDASGDEGTGTLSRGHRHGHWVERFADGTVGEGPYVDGERHGHWVVRFADGAVEEGPLVDGVRHGHWVERFADGRVAEGPYVDGKLHGHWVGRDADGDVYEGPFVDGKKHGQWVLRYADGSCSMYEHVEDELVSSGSC